MHDPPKKHSHQLRALLHKNLLLQSRQPCTNICQILTPIICLIFSILIRNVAISKIPTDNDSIWTQFPTIPQKFNDYTLEDFVPELVRRVCVQWYGVEVREKGDFGYVGGRDGTGNHTGLLGKIRDTYAGTCKYNLSTTYPFPDQPLHPPIFLQKPQSVNLDIYSTISYLNNITEQDLRHTTVLDKIADGAITFYKANPSKLEADLKINDLRLLDYHRADGVTRIRFYNNKSGGFQSYYLISEGLMSLQHAVTAAYMETETGKLLGGGYIYMPFKPNSSILVDILVNTVTTVLFPISLSLLLPVFLYLIVLQKQQKLIQMMRMNGMKMKNYWFVNFVFSFLISMVTNLVFYGFGYFFMDNALFHDTGVDVLVVVLLGWVLAQIGMSTFFQVFLASSRAANIIGYLLSIWTNLIGATLSIAIYQYPRPLPGYFLWYPTFAFNRIFYLMFTQCSADRCFTSLSRVSGQARNCIVVLYVSFVVLQALGMYLFQVVPQEYGTRQPLNFPIKYLISKFKSSQPHQSPTLTLTTTSPSPSSSPSSPNSDQSSKHEKTRIQNLTDLQSHPLIITNLRKVYDNGKIAVKGMNLLLEDREVFGLLGPNGAGKTTLISMITGVFQPTDGDCFVGGYSIKTEIQKVHLNIGVCPQFDLLWPQLTVQQHLYFYTRLRGTPPSQQSHMVKKTLQEVNLTEFKKFKATQLSGGMKRRLSVGISMVGDPRIVFLDQPTTGLDPENRRNLWDVLNRCREDRALFLTTHLMEEADALCNRVGIITQGVLRTVGTQQKLKKTYGNGYYLSLNLQIQKSPDQSEQIYDSAQYPSSSQISQKSPSILSLSEQLQPRAYPIHAPDPKLTKLKVQAIKKQIISVFPQARLDREISGFLRFNLGEVVISEVMRKIAKCENQEIRNNWGLTNSNLEDVFLAVVNKFDSQDEDQQDEVVERSDTIITDDSIRKNLVREEGY